jgi:hypothetical protein
MAEPRKFYMIDFNSNSVHKAAKCLKAGANALEPDVHYFPEYHENSLFMIWRLKILKIMHLNLFIIGQ